MSAPAARKVGWPSSLPIALDRRPLSRDARCQRVKCPAPVAILLLRYLHPTEPRVAYTNDEVVGAPPVLVLDHGLSRDLGEVLDRLDVVELLVDPSSHLIGQSLGDLREVALQPGPR